MDTNTVLQGLFILPEKLFFQCISGRIAGNPIKEDEKHLAGKSAQEVVRYCQEKARTAEK